MFKLRKLLSECVYLSLFLAIASNAQNPPPVGIANRSGRSMFNRGGILASPEISSENKVTFRISAPQANQVTVNGDWGTGFTRE